MIDRIYMKYWNPYVYNVINPACFVRPLNCMGKNWNIYKPNKPGVYYPKIYINRYPDLQNPNHILTVLEVDCNLPKLLYGGNNLYELTNQDWIPVCVKLCRGLRDIGVERNLLSHSSDSVSSVTLLSFLLLS